MNIRQWSPTLGVALIICTAIFMAACGPTTSVDARCYALRFDAFTPALSDEERNLYFPLPETVRLDTALSGNDAWRTLTRMPGPASDLVEELSNEWRMENDSLVMYFPSHWSTGVEVRVPSSDQEVEGVARIRVDVAFAQTPMAKVAVGRIGCASVAWPTEEDR